MKKIFWRNKKSILLLLLLILFVLIASGGKTLALREDDSGNPNEGRDPGGLYDERGNPLQWEKLPLWECEWNVHVKRWLIQEWMYENMPTVHYIDWNEPRCRVQSNRNVVAGSNNFCWENDLRSGIIKNNTPEDVKNREEELEIEKLESIRNLILDDFEKNFKEDYHLVDGQINCCCQAGNTQGKVPHNEIIIPNAECHWAPINNEGLADSCPSKNNIENSLAYCIENDLALNIISENDLEKSKDFIENDSSRKCCCNIKLPAKDLDSVEKSHQSKEYYEEEDDDSDARDGCGWYCGDKYGKGISEITGEKREGDWTGFKYIGCYITCWLAKTLVFIFILPAALLVLMGTIISSLLVSIFALTLKALISVPIKDAVVVREMWMFVRDFANIFYILFFVIIGLATILRIENYKFQKTLPLLLIMALLTNFSLPLVGLIVDIGNVLTSIFIEGVISNASSGGVTSLGWEYFGNIGEFFIGSGGNFGDLFTQGLGWASYGIVLSIFLLFMVVVFFTIIFVFFVRIAALWIVAILSPLAFASYPFQATRNIIWKEWLKNLFQWTIISVPVLFFVFIGFQVMNLNPKEINETFGTDALTANLEESGTIKSSIGEPRNLFGKFIEQIMSPLVALLIMGLGVGISMKMAPEAAQKAANLAKGAAMGAGGFITGKAASGLRNIPRVGEAEMAAKERLESSRIGRLVGLKPGGARAEEAKQLEKHKEALKNMDPERHEKYIKSLRGRERDRASAAALMNKMDEGKSISEEERGLYLPRAQKAVGFNVDKFNGYDPTYKEMYNSKGELLTDQQKADMMLKLSAEAMATQLSDESYNRATPEALDSIVKVVTLNNANFNKWIIKANDFKKGVVIDHAKENYEGLIKSGVSKDSLDKLFTSTGGMPPSP